MAVDGRPRAPMVPDAIAVGDYFLDHHHSKHHLPPEEHPEVAAPVDHVQRLGQREAVPEEEAQRTGTEGGGP